MVQYSITTSSLDGVITLNAPFSFQDSRGENVEIFNKDELRKAGITVDFIRDSLSISYRNVLRGLHGDTRTWKLVTCLYGEIFLVVVDMRLDSPSYLKWESFLLSDKSKLQVLIPPGFANGHVVLSDTALFFYKMSQDHDRSDQFTLAWDDPTLAISWPIHSPILSDRDAGLDPLAPRRLLIPNQ